MTTTVITLSTITLFIIYLALRDLIRFNRIKEQVEYELFKINKQIEETPNNPILYAKRGNLYQDIQNFPEAKSNFIKAKSMIIALRDKNVNDKFLPHLELNLNYIEKPHPWAKSGVRDSSNSLISFFLIERFGNLRYYF